MGGPYQTAYLLHVFQHRFSDHRFSDNIDLVTCFTRSLGAFYIDLVTFLTKIKKNPTINDVLIFF